MTDNNNNTFLNNLSQMSYPINSMTYSIVTTTPDVISQINTLKNENIYLKQIIQLTEDNFKLKNKNKIIENNFVDFLKKTNNWSETESLVYIQNLYSVDKL
jgi:hypothetical protein